jgi:hypothetical protein
MAPASGKHAEEAPSSGLRRKLKGDAAWAIFELALRYDRSRSFSNRVFSDWVLANRIFANWHLANRSLFGDRLRTREVGRTGSSHETESSNSNNQKLQHRDLRDG